MSQFVPELQAKETIEAATQRIREVAAEASREEIQNVVQAAANDLRRVFGIESIFEIVDDGTVCDELLSLKAAVMELEEGNPRISLYAEGEPDTGMGSL
jgi:hypothetical protein|tara:strand:- start:98 stop:394 length:297 start_codon:yes stop_codon:yes gene_type:complete